jgi:hypothetical protein
MLQVLKLGGTLSGRLAFAHNAESASISTPTPTLSSVPIGDLKFDELKHVMTLLSVFRIPCALISVNAYRWICILLIKTGTVYGSSFIRTILSGKAKLGTMIGGAGSRASMEKRTVTGAVLMTGVWRKEPKRPRRLAGEGGV